MISFCDKKDINNFTKKRRRKVQTSHIHETSYFKSLWMFSFHDVSPVSRKFHISPSDHVLWPAKEREAQITQTGSRKEQDQCEPIKMK